MKPPLSTLISDLPHNLLFFSHREALHTAEQKVEELRSRVLIQDSLSAHETDGTRKYAGVCVKCGRREAVIAAQYDQSSTVQQLTQ